MIHSVINNKWNRTRHHVSKHLVLSLGTDWFYSDKSHVSNVFWCQRSSLLNLSSTEPLWSGSKVINPSSYLRWLRRGWSRSSDCTAGKERAVICTTDRRQLSNCTQHGFKCYNARKQSKEKELQVFLHYRQDVPALMVPFAVKTQTHNFMNTCMQNCTVASSS